MPESQWADRDYLRGVQYKTDANLAARQSIYAYQEPKIDLPAAILDIVRLSPRDVIADVGCGNGAYLGELARRGFGGPGAGENGHVVGIDMSPGMLAAARVRDSGATALVNADATALPLRSASADVTLAMHMLYHVPEPLDAVRELRRITRPGGRVVVALNGSDHLREFRVAISAAAGTNCGSDRIRLDDGETLLRSVFGSVTRHDFEARLHAPPAAVAAYLSSGYGLQEAADPGSLLAGIMSRLFHHDAGPCSVTTHSGILVCA
ncbi:MAG TPA: class I SAM-dependent methyltransferase [Trebonia sp.]|nr:class I SAM-dependent methyltransferase [Trebonia sp.]